MAPPSAPPSRSASRARSAAPSTACSPRAAATTRCARRWRLEDKFLEALRDWNTTATHSLSAQRLLHAILKGRTVAQLAALPGAQALVEAILPYSERHYERVDRLVQSAYFVEFTLRAMGMILPPADANGDADADADPPAAAADGADADAADDDDDAEAAAAAAAELAAAKKARAAKGRRGSAASGGEGKKRRRSA